MVILCLLAISTQYPGRTDSNHLPEPTGAQQAPVVLSIASKAKAVEFQSSTPRQSLDKQSKQHIGPNANYSTSNDLYSFFLQYRNSENAGLVLQVAEAAQICYSFFQNFDYLGTLASGGIVDPPVLNVTQARRDAIDEINRRCSGFLRVDSSARKTARNEARAKAAGLGALEGKYSGVNRSVAVSHDDLKSLLASASGVNKDLLLNPLSSLARQYIESGPDSESVSGMASYLALCDLSGACGSDGVQAKLLCAWGGTCKALDADWELDFTPAQRLAISDLRNKLLDTIRSKRL